MGAQLSLITPSAATVAIDAYVLELGDVQYERSLGNARFFKTILGSRNNALMTVKVFIKPDDEMNLRDYYRKLIDQRNKLATVANAIAYDRIMETDRAGYLAREYFKANLYDRISTRPFLEHIEKVWITYQLLQGLKDCHAAKVYHGDIKSENVMVTSWNWVYLTDFASFFKPVYLPEDDPSQFSFFFDTSQRRSCYVAPERFLSHGEEGADIGLTEAMDVFSLGCVIAELFLEGSPIFTLAQLFKYKKKEYVPLLAEIEDENIRALISSMISLDPGDREGAADYLVKYKGKAFPEYFEFLHPYVNDIIKPFSPNEKMNSKKLECDNRIIHIWNDYEMIAKQLGIKYDGASSLTEYDPSCPIPVRLDIPGMNYWIPNRKKMLPGKDDGALMMLNIITSSIRACSRSSAREKATYLILALGEQVHDEAKLDRCLPYLIGLLDDTSDNVQMSAIKCITHLLTLVGSITALQENILSEYILPKFLLLLSKSSAIVRATYASCLPTLAQTASRFLDMGQVLKAAGLSDEIDVETENGGGQELYNNTAFDSLRLELLRDIEAQARMILADNDREVKRALLRSVGPLCFFFGRQKTSDVILSHAITFLNDRDPFLRLELFDSMVGIAPYIGTVGLLQYVLPLMLQTLTDPEEFVVERVIQSLCAFCDMGLLPLGTIWEILRLCAKFIIHPNNWIRISALGLFSSSTRWMSAAHINCILLPILRPFLECDIVDFSEANLLENAKDPLPRPIYNLTMTWATKAQKSLFWKDTQRTHRGNGNDRNQTLSKYASPRVKGGTKAAISSEDENWLNRLREIGLQENQLWMIACYKDYIYSVASLKSSKEESSTTNSTEGVVYVNIQSLGAMPQTVFFDYTRAKQERRDRAASTVSHAMDLTHMEEEAKRAGNGAALLGETTNSQLTEVSFMHTRSPSTKTAEPVVATNTDTVYGEVGPSRHSPIQVSQSKFSSYTGKNPYAWKLLQAVYQDPTARQPLAFGSRCEPFSPVNDSAKDVTVKRRKGRPLGLLISNFEEHQGAINAIAVSADHYFFLTGSDDGTIKVWDSSRLEKNVINKSVQTFNCGSPVKAISFIDGTYTFSAGCADGCIRIIKVEFNGENYKYRQLHLLHLFNLPDDQSCVSLAPVSTPSSSVLYIATNRNKIYEYNFGQMTVSRTMENPESHGIITALVADRQSNWILVGTSRGILDLWDVRFGIRVRAWGMSGGGKPITGLCLHPKHRKSVCVTGGVSRFSDVSVWDMEMLECKEVYRGGGSTEISTIYNPVDVDRALSDHSEEYVLSKLSINELTISSLTSEARPVLCVASGIDFGQGAHYSSGSSSTRHGYLVTGGKDRVLRFWDLHSPEMSAIVSGKGDTDKAAYTIHNGRTRLVSEKVGNVKAGKGKNDRTARPSVIASEQADLGRNHQASITAVCVLRRPYDMIISGDVGGTLKVFM